MSQSQFSDFSMMDPVVSSDPYHFYELLHKQCPVYQIPETGYYVVTKYDDVKRVLKDYQSFSNDVRLKHRTPHADLHQQVLREGGGLGTCTNAATHRSPCPQAIS